MNAETSHYFDFVQIPKSALVFSLVLHGALFLFIVSVKVMDHFGITLFPKSAPKSQIYQDTIQVDIVALPDQLVTQSVDTSLPVTSKVAAPPKSLPTPPAPPDIITEPAAKRVTKTSDHGKAREQDEALKRLRAEAEREEAMQALAQKEATAGRKNLAGNRLSAGTSTQGLLGTEHDRYAALIKRAIQQNFSVFAWQKRKGLVTVVHVEILSNGRIRSKKIERASSDSIFDNAVLSAIDSSQPLPLPEDLSLLSGGLTLEFRPEE